MHQSNFLYISKPISFSHLKPFELQTANIIQLYITHFISIHTNGFNKLMKKEIQINLFAVGMIETCLPCNFQLRLIESVLM